MTLKYIFEIYTNLFVLVCESKEIPMISIRSQILINLHSAFESDKVTIENRKRIAFACNKKYIFENYVTLCFFWGHRNQILKIQKFFLSVKAAVFSFKRVLFISESFLYSSRILCFRLNIFPLEKYKITIKKMKYSFLFSSI